MEIHKPIAQRYARVLIYGPPGRGKTVFLGTAQFDARTRPILILDFEGGSSSLVGLDVDVLTVTSWAGYERAYEYLASGKHPYKSIGIDSISETYRFSMLNVLKSRPAEVRADPDILTLQDWGKVQTQMRRFLRAFRDLPMHVFFTALAKDDPDPKEGMVKKVDFSGSLADEVAGMMDVVAYLALVPAEDAEGETKRALLLKNIPKFRVKVRTPWNSNVPDVIYDPTVTTLLDALGFENEAK